MQVDVPTDWQRLFVGRDGTWIVDAAAPARTVLMPGSFHPAHAGHWGLAATAAQLLGRGVAFEISVRNVDKAEMPLTEAARRAAQFAGRADVWLTRAARFVDKARLFPGAIFVLGADTAQRLVDSRYYGNDDAAMRAALEAIAACDCRFLVAARVDAAGRCVTLADLALPACIADRCDAIPIERFRLDISSSQLRSQAATN
jgi:nicotinic acid mononucleotide adenylyltransferase